MFDIGPNHNVHIEEPAEVRFLSGTLQQRWIITEIQNEQPAAPRSEWRDVPEIEDPRDG